jgi:hypothetical protein
VEPLTAAVVVLAVLVLLLAAAGAGLLRRIRELELTVYRGVGLRFAGPPAPGPGSPVTTPGRVAVVAKLNRRCAVCAEVLAALGERAGAASAGNGTVADGTGPGPELIVLSDDPELAGRAPAGVRVIADPAVWRAVDVPFLPALLIVDQHGIVVDTHPAGSGAVVAEAVRQAETLGRVS